MVCWLAVVGKVSMAYNLRRRCLTDARILDIYVLCRKKGEKVNHLFLHCEVVAGIWSYFLARCGIAWCCLESIVEETESYVGGTSVGCGHSLCRFIPYAILWSIWREK